MTEADEVLGILRPEANDIERWIERRTWLRTGYMLIVVADVIEYGAQVHSSSTVVGPYDVRALRSKIEVNTGGPTGELVDLHICEGVGTGDDARLLVRIPLAATTAVVAALRSKAANRS